MTTTDQLNKLIDDYGNLKRLQGKYDEMGVRAPHDLISQICNAWDLIVQHLVAAEVISEIIADNKLKAENLVLRNRVAEMRAALVIAEGFVQGGKPEDCWIRPRPHIGRNSQSSEGLR